jgi:hypothetical protein
MIVAILPQGELLSALMKQLEINFPSYNAGLLPAGGGYGGTPIFNVHTHSASDSSCVGVEAFCNGFINGWRAKENSR